MLQPITAPCFRPCTQFCVLHWRGCSAASIPCGEFLQALSSSVLLLPGAGHDLKPENVTELQKLAERMTLVAERRAAFISLFLEQ